MMMMMQRPRHIPPDREFYLQTILQWGGSASHHINMPAYYAYL